MGKNELIVKLADRAGVRMSHAAALLDAYIDLVSETVSAGDQVLISNHGVYSAQNGQPHFRPFRRFRERVGRQ